MEKIANNQIGIRIVPSTQYVLNGIVNKLYVMFEFTVDKIKTEEKKRTPLELSLVLDRSGSMSGDKIVNSRIAIKKVIQNLHGDDVLHMVQYDDTVDVVFKDGNIKNKDKLIKKVMGIEPRNMTNLSGGVIKGHELIDSSKKNARSKRVFLFSDGLANHGVTDKNSVFNIIKGIYAKGINVSAFGIGSDFDEDMMKGIAEHGSGDFFYIENADAIPNIVSEGLEGLLGIVGSNTVLKVRGLNGATVTKIFDYDLKTGATLGDLRDTETRQVLVEMEVRPENMEGDDVLTYSLEYNPIEDLLKSESFNRSFSIKRTDDENLIMEENEEVLVLRKLLEAAEEEEKTISLIDEGRYDDAIAIQKKNIAFLQSFEEKDSKGIIADKLEMAQASLESMEEGKKRGDMRASRKQQRYSSYLSKSSKKRRK